MHEDPQREHEWLHRLVGEWSYEHTCNMGPEQPPSKMTGREVVRLLGGFWAVCEGEGEMPGGGVGRTIITLGYDPRTQHYVGTFVGSMMSHLWAYNGVLDRNGSRLVLDTQGPSFTGSGLASYQDIFEFKNDDHRTLTSQVRQEDGSWHQFMTANYHRIK